MQGDSELPEAKFLTGAIFCAIVGDIRDRKTGVAGYNRGLARCRERVLRSASSSTPCLRNRPPPPIPSERDPASWRFVGGQVDDDSMGESPVRSQSRSGIIPVTIAGDIQPNQHSSCQAYRAEATLQPAIRLGTERPPGRRGCRKGSGVRTARAASRAWQSVPQKRENVFSFSLAEAFWKFTAGAFDGG